GRARRHGGIHATMRLDEARERVDSVVTGEAERVWAQVLADTRHGGLKCRYDGGFAEIDKVPPARHDLLAGGYAFGAVQTTRGCPMNCTFCKGAVTARCPFVLCVAPQMYLAPQLCGVRTAAGKRKNPWNPRPTSAVTVSFRYTESVSIQSTSTNPPLSTASWPGWPPSIQSRLSSGPIIATTAVCGAAAHGLPHRSHRHRGPVQASRPAGAGRGDDLGESAGGD